MVRGFRLMREIFNQPALAKLGGHEHPRSASATTDAEIEQFIRSYADTIYHPVGTCRMGPGAMDVVGADLRIHGLDGIRVVDASMMPRIIGGNTNAPTIMVAEKASDMIKAARLAGSDADAADAARVRGYRVRRPSRRWRPEADRRATRGRVRPRRPSSEARGAAASRRGRSIGRSAAGRPTRSASVRLSPAGSARSAAVESASAGHRQRSSCPAHSVSKASGVPTGRLNTQPAFACRA